MFRDTLWKRGVITFFRSKKKGLKVSKMTFGEGQNEAHNSAAKRNGLHWMQSEDSNMVSKSETQVGHIRKKQFQLRFITLWGKTGERCNLFHYLQWASGRLLMCSQRHWGRCSVPSLWGDPSWYAPRCFQLFFLVEQERKEENATAPTKNSGSLCLLWCLCAVALIYNITDTNSTWDAVAAVSHPDQKKVQKSPKPVHQALQH